MSADGMRLAIGAKLNSGSGQVRIFDLVNNDWQQIATGISHSLLNGLGAGFAVQAAWRANGALQLGMWVDPLIL